MTEPEVWLEACDVYGRVAKMVVFLMRHGERINQATRGSVEFHFEGNSLRPKIIEAFDQVTTDVTDPSYRA